MRPEDTVQSGCPRSLTWPRGYKIVSCSTQLSVKFSLLINMKMPTTIVGIFTFISRENVMLSYFSKKESAIVNDLRFISRTNFML